MKSMVRCDTPSGRNFHVVKGAPSSSPIVNARTGEAPLPGLLLAGSPCSLASHVLHRPRPCSRTT